MNAGGHIAVAVGLDGASADPGFLLGAALPDLSTMGGFRLLGASPDPAVAAGIRLHHRTDDAFHRHPWFSERNRSLHARLLAQGVARGPARACSHVGIELLLDGQLLAEPSFATATDAAFTAIESRLHALEPLVSTEEIHGWRLHLGLLAERRLPTDYADADAVARRLYRILMRRPRLALPEQQIEAVASALLDAQPSIAETAISVVAALTEDLRLPSGSQTGH